MTTIRAAVEALRTRAADLGQNLADPENGEPWDREWWQQQRDETLAVADLLEAIDWHGTHTLREYAGALAAAITRTEETP